MPCPNGHNLRRKLQILGVITVRSRSVFSLLLIFLIGLIAASVAVPLWAGDGLLLDGHIHGP